MALPSPAVNMAAGKEAPGQCNTVATSVSPVPDDGRQLCCERLTAHPAVSPCRDRRLLRPCLAMAAVVGNESGGDVCTSPPRSVRCVEREVERAAGRRANCLDAETSTFGYSGACTADALHAARAAADAANSGERAAALRPADRGRAPGRTDARARTAHRCSGWQRRPADRSRAPHRPARRARTDAAPRHPGASRS